jgi:hypothetical protein
MNTLHPDTIVPQFASSDHVFGSAYLSLFSESQREEAGLHHHFEVHLFPIVQETRPNGSAFG